MKRMNTRLLANILGTHPRAMAPTNTAMEWDWGKVGRYSLRRTGRESPDRADMEND